MKNILTALVLVFSLNGFSQNYETKENKKIYSLEAVDQKPEFPGGNEKLVNYINKNYVEAGFKNDLKSKVAAIFVVEKDGSLTDIEVLNAPNQASKVALTKIISTALNWNPGKLKGETVRVKSSVVIQGSKKVRTLELSGKLED